MYFSCKAYNLFVFLATIQALVVMSVSFAPRGCDVAPKHWCDDADVAARCEVRKQCSRHIWNKQGSEPITSAPPVGIELYYEMWCGGCQSFIKDQLFPTFNKIGSIMNITLVPYGNAKEKKDGDKWDFTCQHGPWECEGNILETCTIYESKNVSAWLPMIHCLEENVLADDKLTDIAKKCAKDLGFGQIDDVLKCLTSPLGNKLEHDMALLTDALVPRHSYVPWITVNGKWTQKGQSAATNDLLKLVCDLYTGTKPRACKQ